MRILRFAQNDKGGTPCSLLFTPSVRQSRTAPPSRGSCGGAQIGGPARAQRSGMGDPAEGGTPFAGRAGAAERTKPAACGRMRDAQLATATGEDEQGSGARNARQPRGPHKADQPCGERTNSGANETCPQGRGERCETCEDVTVRTLRGRRRAPHKEALRPIPVILRP